MEYLPRYMTCGLVENKLDKIHCGSGVWMDEGMNPPLHLQVRKQVDQSAQGYLVDCR